MQVFSAIAFMTVVNFQGFDSMLEWNRKNIKIVNWRRESNSNARSSRSLRWNKVEREDFFNRRPGMIGERNFSQYAVLVVLVETAAGPAFLFEKRAEMMKDARTFITGNPYDRLILAKKYKDSRPDALILLEDAMKLLRRTIAANGDTSALRAATRLESLHKRIIEQGNVRLQLSAAVMV